MRELPARFCAGAACRGVTGRIVGGMSDARRDINAFVAGSVPLLVTVTSSGRAIHLTAGAGAGAGRRGAVPEHYREEARTFGYDPADVADPRWAETTLCGRPWLLMAGGDGDEDEAIAAPSCRRCLALMDRFFPAPEPDERLPLVAHLLADAVAGHGYAEITAVPGDQQAGLRVRVRAEVRRRTGYGCRTYVLESMVIFVCEPISARRNAQLARTAGEAMGGVLDSVPSRGGRRPWQLSWETWAAGT
jgi:hypothetical protein